MSTSSRARAFGLVVFALGCDPDPFAAQLDGPLGSQAFDTTSESGEPDESGESDDSFAGEESGDAGGEAGLDLDDTLSIAGEVELEGLDHRVRIHSSHRVVELQIPAAELDGWMRGDYPELAAASTARLYQWWRDEFDFIVFATEGWQPRATIPYSGKYIAVKNHVAGIGLPLFDRGAEYGSAGRLQGILHLNGTSAVMFGPSLHELGHRWGNYVLPSAYPSHWGLADVGGQLGGFGEGELDPLGSSRYHATLDGGTWGPVANNGNSVGYAPIELYLMGLLAPGEVPPVVSAGDGEYLGSGEFVGAVATTEIEAIIADHGVRVPDHGLAQREFSVLFVVLSAERVDPPQFDGFERVVADFTRAAAPVDYPGIYNFWLATEGRAALRRIDMLARLR